MFLWFLHSSGLLFILISYSTDIHDPLIDQLAHNLHQYWPITVYQYQFICCLFYGAYNAEEMLVLACLYRPVIVGTGIKDQVSVGLQYRITVFDLNTEIFGGIYTFLHIMQNDETSQLVKGRGNTYQISGQL